MIYLFDTKTIKKLMKHLMKITAISLMMFLSVSCSTLQYSFNPEFEIWSNHGEKRACMTKDKVKELAQLLELMKQ